jgi:hypothetical protein
MDQELKQHMRDWARNASLNSFCNMAEDMIKYWSDVPDPELQAYAALAVDVRMGVPGAIYALQQAMLIHPTIQ